MTFLVRANNSTNNSTTSSNSNASTIANIFGRNTSNDIKNPSNNELTNIVNETVQRINSIETKLSNSEQKYDSRLTDTNTTVNNYKKRVDDLQKSIDENGNLLQKMQSHLTELQSKYSCTEIIASCNTYAPKTEIDALRATLDNLNSKYDTVNALSASMKAELSQLNARQQDNSNLIAQNHSMVHNQIDKNTTSIAVNTTDIAKCLTNITNFEHIVADFNRQFENVKSCYDVMNTSLATLSADIKTNATAIDKITDSITISTTETTKSIMDLNNRTVSLEGQTLSNQNSIRTVESKIESMLNDIKNNTVRTTSEAFPEIQVIKQTADDAKYQSQKNSSELKQLNDSLIQLQSSVGSSSGVAQQVFDSSIAAIKTQMDTNANDIQKNTVLLDKHTSQLQATGLSLDKLQHETNMSIQAIEQSVYTNKAEIQGVFAEQRATYQQVQGIIQVLATQVDPQFRVIQSDIAEYKKTNASDINSMKSSIATMQSNAINNEQCKAMIDTNIVDIRNKISQLTDNATAVNMLVEQINDMGDAANNQNNKISTVEKKVHRLEKQIDQLIYDQSSCAHSCCNKCNKQNKHRHENPRYECGNSRYECGNNVLNKKQQCNGQNNVLTNNTNNASLTPASKSTSLLRETCMMKSIGLKGNKTTDQNKQAIITYNLTTLEANPVPVVSIATSAGQVCAANILYQNSSVPVLTPERLTNHHTSDAIVAEQIGVNRYTMSAMSNASQILTAKPIIYKAILGNVYISCFRNTAANANIIIVSEKGNNSKLSLRYVIINNEVYCPSKGNTLESYTYVDKQQVLTTYAISNDDTLAVASTKVINADDQFAADVNILRPVLAKDGKTYIQLDKSTATYMTVAQSNKAIELTIGDVEKQDVDKIQFQFLLA
jgi:chromosome segregation ATPase